jgi:hypothetical protein
MDVETLHFAVFHSPNIAKLHQGYYCLYDSSVRCGTLNFPPFALLTLDMALRAGVPDHLK